MCKGMGLFFGKKEVCWVVFDRRRRHLGIESRRFDDFTREGLDNSLDG